MNKIIELTKEELEDCKKEAANDAVFKYEVLHKQKLLFKMLNGLPERVASLWGQSKCQWGLLVALFLLLIGIFLNGGIK